MRLLPRLVRSGFLSKDRDRKGRRIAATSIHPPIRAEFNKPLLRRESVSSSDPH